MIGTSPNLGYLSALKCCGVVHTDDDQKNRNFQSLPSILYVICFKVISIIFEECEPSSTVIINQSSTKMMMIDGRWLVEGVETHQAANLSLSLSLWLCNDIMDEEQGQKWMCVKVECLFIVINITGEICKRLKEYMQFK